MRSTCWRQGYRGGRDIARITVGRIVYGGLKGRDGGGFLLVLFEQLLHQERDGAFALFGLADFGGWGEGA
jgi:hypothetical protein